MWVRAPPSVSTLRPGATEVAQLVEHLDLQQAVQNYPFGGPVIGSRGGFDPPSLGPNPSPRAQQHNGLWSQVQILPGSFTGVGSSVR